MMIVGDRLERMLQLVIGTMIIGTMYIAVEFYIRTGYFLDTLVLYLMIVGFFGSVFLLSELVFRVYDKFMERN